MRGSHGKRKRSASDPEATVRSSNGINQEIEAPDVGEPLRRMRTDRGLSLDRLGTTENLVVSSGHLEVLVAGRKIELRAGDATFFLADVSHEYRNLGTQAVIAYLVMTYTRSV